MAAFGVHIVMTRVRDATPGVLTQDYTNCNVLTSDQRAQLATPSYKLKKEKLDNKSDTPS